MSETAPPESEVVETTAPTGPGTSEFKSEESKKALLADLAGEREQRKALQKQLDDIAAANLSDLEKAQRAATEAQEAASKATAEAMRLRVAAKHGISDEDADLFLTGSDPETVERQAAALAARTSTNPKPDLSQGAKGSPATGDPAQDFASFLGAQLGSRG